MGDFLWVTHHDKITKKCHCFLKGGMGYWWLLQIGSSSFEIVCPRWDDVILLWLSLSLCQADPISASAKKNVNIYHVNENPL